MVGCDWKLSAGHWFNAVNYDGKVMAVDGQSGRIENWPPSANGLSFDESGMRWSDAIFFTADRKVVQRMITREQAEHAASNRFGPSQEGERRNWELIEFSAGWLVLRNVAVDAGRRGAAMHVIERDSGTVMVFPSSVPPQRILDDYSAVLGSGHTEDEIPPA